MKTTHATMAVSSSTIGSVILGALRESNIRGDYRIIRCGAGLVLLPETDRSKDATENEVIKALGFRDKADKMPDDGERSTYAVNREGEFQFMVSLTPTQVRFLRWCQSEDLFWDEVDFSVQKSSVIEI